MFQINYQIVKSEYDDFAGQNGFFQIQCNDCNYGELYPEEIERVVDKEDLYRWFERLTRTVLHLLTKDYVVLSDTESYHTWIEFRRNQGDLTISIIIANKERGSRDIEFELNGIKQGQWVNQHVSFFQFKREVIEKSTCYLEEIEKNCANIALVKKLKNAIIKLENI